MLQLADAAERQGTLMRAAQTLVAASLPGRHGLLPWAKEDALTQRGLQLLETKLDGGVTPVKDNHQLWAERRAREGPQDAPGNRCWEQ